MNGTKMRGESNMLIGIMAITAVFIVGSLLMPDWESRILPLVLSSLVFVLAALKLRQERLKEKHHKVETATVGEDEHENEKWWGLLINGGWVGGLVLANYLLGLLIAIPLFVLLYTKRLGTRWRTSLVCTVLSTVFIVGVFEVALDLKLYRGLLVNWLGL